MPRLLDILSDDSSKDKLTHLGRQAKENGRSGNHPTHGSAAPSPARTGRQPDHPPGADASAQSIPPAFVTPDFVALDLETTGLNPKADRIIEAAAVRFRAGEAAGEYATFVNPGMPIPEAVRRLTGISDADVATAPAFEAVLDQLLAFIGAMPLCGHQVEFDVSFLNEALKRAGRPALSNQQLDSAALARLSLPDLPGYSLTHVARHLELPLANAHRALDDARASGLAAAVLLPRLTEIPPDVRRVMADFAPRSLLKKSLLDSLRGATLGRAPRTITPVRLPPLEPSDEPVAVDEGAIVTAFAADGGLAKLVAGFAPRRAQTQMAVAVAQVFGDKELFAVEAGTGTGKSLAYLVPAALYALANRRRVLISTHTRNLQDQLATKDLPLVRDLVGPELRFSVLKGRTNYLCRSRYRRLLAGELTNLAPREREGLLPLIRWAEQTRTGDIEEQRQFNRAWHNRVWSLISAEGSGCLGPRCQLSGECFLQAARQRALAAHVVVINHSLFYSEAASESSFLGPLGPIVFDEAHHLESCGHRSLCVVADTNRFTGFLDLCTNLVNRLEKAAVAGPGDGALAADLRRRVRVLRHNAEDLLASLAAWALARQPSTAEYQCPVEPRALTALAGPGSLQLALSEVQDVLLQVQRSLSPGEEARAVLAGDVQTCASQASQLRADLEYLCAAVTPEHVFWLEGNREKGWVKLCGVPLDIGATLAALWERSGEAAVFTSATLSVAASLDYFMRRIGLTGANAARSRGLCLPSPFSPEQALRAVMRSGPEPSAPEFARFCASTIGLLHRSLERNILVLFTANAMLRDVERELRSAGIVDASRLFSQAGAGSRALLLTEFTNARNAVLLGSASFWEGIDAPGSACELVVIPRLPFQVPTDPLAQALAARAEEQSGDSFYSYTVPEAVIRLRQGAGRLIRSASDRGALVVLDSRMATRPYGRAFADSLGGEVRIFDDSESLVAALSAFFGRETGKADRLRYVPLEDAGRFPDDSVA
jgi:predicted DnaQ family exonuclease/DinG family helicase